MNTIRRVANSQYGKMPIVKLGIILMMLLLAVIIVQVVIPFFSCLATNLADPVGAQSSPQPISITDFGS